MAAKAALDAAGSEYADSTVNGFCILAKFDYESTSSQRAIWRRYGTSVPLQFAMAGWSQSAAADFLRGDRKSYKDARAAVSTTAKPRSSARPFDERCSQWVQRANKLMMDGAELLAESETLTTVGSQAEMALMIYQRLAERHMDAEIRRFFETEAVG